MCFLFLHSKQLYVLCSSIFNSCGFLVSHISVFFLFLCFSILCSKQCLSSNLMLYFLCVYARWHFSHMEASFLYFKQHHPKLSSRTSSSIVSYIFPPFQTGPKTIASHLVGSTKT
jgi:hypothetical protein